MNFAYGGVVINRRGEVLLREPANHFDGYSWTFAKGRPEHDEEPQTTAVREVCEETGVVGEIIKRLPGEFRGSTTRNIYYLMKPFGIVGDFDREETQAIQWATVEEAKRLLALSANPAGRQRDLAVLAAAVKAWKASGENHHGI